MQETDCRANFAWKYGVGQEVKGLEVQSIDLIVYRKNAPNNLAKLMEQHKVGTEST